uniref:Phorbol esters/diacylglycerol binding domain protein n=1 Tax=Angiostrongylus cantonensis TaxID=6313 RepID=A0A0K0DBM3_ANGCA
MAIGGALNNANLKNISSIYHVTFVVTYLLERSSVLNGCAFSQKRHFVTYRPSYAWMRALSVRQPLPRQISLSFEQWSPEDISTSLTHIDYKALSRISIIELKQYVKDGSPANTPMLERSISIFNNLSNWVQIMVLSKTTPNERALLVTKFVNVGKHLRKLCNFNTLMAVIGGITHSNISRLSKTNSQIAPDTRKDLNQLTNLLSVQSNFAEYRKALAALGVKFRIPIIGVHLKDLVAATCCGEDFDKTLTISLRRLHRLGTLLSHFMICNQRQHNFPDANLDLINTLRVSLDIRYNEEDIYELSVRREPRTLMTFESNTPVVFAEWASGVSAALDPGTVNKHVSAMVDAVFKHYDHDRDGYISEAEFRQISGNFPFIDPFGTIDLDRDGQISKEELKTYFVKTNNDSVDFRLGFKHNFHETTFLTPTSCSHCNRLLWGLIRQGWKCKDCGLAVHCECKANAVAECRRKSSLVDWITPKADVARTKLFSKIRDGLTSSKSQINGDYAGGRTTSEDGYQVCFCNELVNQAIICSDCHRK